MNFSSITAATTDCIKKVQFISLHRLPKTTDSGQDVKFTSYWGHFGISEHYAITLNGFSPSNSWPNLDCTQSLVDLLCCVSSCWRQTAWDLVLPTANIGYNSSDKCHSNHWPQSLWNWGGYETKETYWLSSFNILRLPQQSILWA